MSKEKLNEKKIEEKKEDSPKEKELEKEEKKKDEIKASEETPAEKPEEKKESDLKEQLSVIKEVRGELAKAYGENKKLLNTNDGLLTDMQSLKHELAESNRSIEALSKKVNSFETKEKQKEATVYNKRLETLSANFKELGQEKTVEQLSKMDKSVITEFETITGIALEKRASEKLDTQTVPTQAMSAKKEEELEKPAETKTDFLTGICKTLSEQQNVSGSDAKRIIHL